jgi:hypothetical protein
VFEFIKKHWKSFLTGLAIVLAFVVGLFARGQPVPGAAAIKQSELDTSRATDAANNAVKQLASDQRATQAGIGQVDKLLGTTGDAVESAGQNLVDESKKLI